MRGLRDFRWSALNRPLLPIQKPKRNKEVVLGELWNSFGGFNSSLAPWG